MSQSLSRRSFLKYAGSGAVSLAAALLTGVSGAALAPCYEGEPALLDGKAAVELLGYAPAPELDSTLVYLSLETALNAFLGGLDAEKRNIFVRRYWYLDSVADIAKRYGISESKVKTTLFRCRNRLREHLNKEGYTV